ncbi:MULTISPECIES: cytochrome c biogenesis protein [Flavobacteriaceae]|uniref:Cytochrome C biogenesis protein n=2 Tax=Flavobacteriaceae TaxID=49546 RepID=A0A4Y8ATR0_9FLAO|nr:MULTISPECIES: cytochrome c biogenesis protein CcsA [Flavobacteriaceae]TEW75281.1 cytochrome C biogenesis protein [Gramella jeungdoensis]GGK43931.1 cytochrome c biogenesis protein [Lutibacter litoralis]
MNKLLSLIYSTRLMAILFLIFALAMGVATFIENDYGTETAKALVYNAWWFEGIMIFFAINFFGNVFKYKLLRKEKLVVLAFHLAFFLIIIGAGVTRYISFEGIMPIKEGQVTNKFLTEKNYISIVVNDGNEQKTPVHHSILLSALGSNNYSYNTDFKGKDVEVKLTNYIPNAQQVFEESETGDEYMLFVESGAGGRHNHYIKRGTSELVHGVLVGYDAQNNNTIDFKNIDGNIKIKSAVEGSFFRMADSFEGTIVKDSLQDFSLLAVHSIAGMQFVVPNASLKGYYKTISGDKDVHTLGELTFDVSAGDETKQVKLVGGKFAIQPPTQISVGGLNFRMSYGAMQKQLPFSIKLNDFQLDKYPGSNSPMSFASEVTVIDPSETFDFRIFMNNILNYKGYKFFQSSYNITDEYEETHLSVNHDFWGSTITYIGYFLLYAGLMLIMFVKNTRFDFLKKSLDKIRTKKAILSSIAIILFSTISFAQEHNHGLTNKQIDSALVENKIDLAHSEKFSKVVIQDAGGRMKPVHTYASELLRKVSKQDTYKDMNATQVFLSIQQNPRLWFQVPIIYIEKDNTKLRDIVGIAHDQKYATLANFFDSKGMYKISETQQEAQKSNIKSKFEKDVINVDRRVNLLYSAITGDVLRIFPIPNDQNNTWVSNNNIQSAHFKGQDSVFVRQILPIYLQTLSDSNVSKDYSKTDEILEGIINFQKKYGGEVYPADHKIDLEIAYNKYDIFKTIYSYYMYIGTLMFFFVIFQIFKNNKAINFLIKASIAIIIGLFLLHTGGLIARWIVSGNAPWSNAYESMIYVGWATMLFGLLFGRKSSMTIAATAFLTAFILMVAHWNWMDPEIANLQPVLNSYWLMIHVSIIVASYGPFALGMILGLIALILMIITNSKNKKKVGLMIKEITIINEMALTIGLILLVIGNFLGGQWANESWGRYWGWDPKETWALISIMIYAFVLHLRLVPGLRGRFVFNLFSVAAFASILMTYFGVNFYLSGLHSYASGDKAITPTFVYYSIAIVSVLAIFAFVQYKKYYKK